MTHRSLIYLRVISIAGFVVTGFVLFQAPSRRFEASLSAGLLRALGLPGVLPAQGDLIPVVPAHHPPFAAMVTPSCSSITAVLAVFALGLVAPHPNGRRKAVALALAIVLVVVANVVRIAAVVAVGLYAGTVALVLFHNWAGGLFTFGSILGAYILFLYMLLPRSKPVLPPAPAPTPAHAQS